jgi:hypothetical protein
MLQIHPTNKTGVLSNCNSAAQQLFMKPLPISESTGLALPQHINDKAEKNVPEGKQVCIIDLLRSDGDCLSPKEQRHAFSRLCLSATNPGLNLNPKSGAKTWYVDRK